MVLPQQRDSTALGSWNSAATLASAITALGLAMTWPVEGTQAPPKDQLPAYEPCTGGDEVSTFVCRNRWVAHLAHNHR